VERLLLALAVEKDMDAGKILAQAGGLFRGVEQAHQLAGRLRLRGAARDLRLLGKPRTEAWLSKQPKVSGGASQPQATRELMRLFDTAEKAAAGAPR
jgi:hypothetical protein